MSSPLHAAYYADHCRCETVEIVENVRIARETWRLRFRAPELASTILPGQFLMIRLAGFDDPLIGRPLALYDVVMTGGPQPTEVDVVYLVKGKLTSRLEQCLPGQQVEVWGPLGNGFVPRMTDHLIMVAGGIGQTPFPAVAQQYLGLRQYGGRSTTAPWTRRVTLCYGARSAEYLAGLEDFERIGVDVQIATDDGTRGHHGLVTDVLCEVLRAAGPDRHVVCCGPEPMMEAVTQLTSREATSCEVSLETPMACGVGICFTCVAKVRDASGAWDYKRTCVEGPVFDAERIEWA